MAIELDHVFICVARGAPEAEHLVEFGLCEGAPNVHPGQGTANRRFFFQNAMLELLWVEDPQEAQSSQTAPTLLWERWSSRQSGACPFGIIARPANTPITTVPFPAREYQPEWLAPELKIYLAPSGVEEPMWLFMPFLQGLHQERRFVAHPNGAREITKLTLTTPVPLRSSAAQALVENAILSIREGSEYLLTIELNKSMRQVVRDFRPHLPLVIQL
jgi:Glyoxalase-like domain